MKNITVTCLFLQLIFSGFLFGQSIDRHKAKVNDKAFTYYIMKPNLEVSGILLLLPGSGENPKSIFDKTDLPQIMVKKGFLIVVPELHNSLFADHKTINELNTIIQDYNVSNLVIGGL